MKLHLIVCGAGLVLSPALQAQSACPAPTISGSCPQCTQGQAGPEAPHWECGSGDLLQKLATTLNLTADQQTAVKPVVEAFQTQMKAIWGDNSLTKEQKVAKFRDACDATNNQMNGLLTPAQQQQLAALRTQYCPSQPSATP